MEVAKVMVSITGHDGCGGSSGGDVAASTPSTVDSLPLPSPAAVAAAAVAAAAAATAAAAPGAIAAAAASAATSITHDPAALPRQTPGMLSSVYVASPEEAIIAWNPGMFSYESVGAISVLPPLPRSPTALVEAWHPGMLLDLSPAETRGRPIKFLGSSPHRRRRLKDRAIRAAQKINPHSKRSRGRPRSAVPLEPARAKQKRVARIEARFQKEIEAAREKTHAVKETNPESFVEAFGRTSSFVGCMRKIASTTNPKGATNFPDEAKEEAERQMYEEVGRGSCQMLRAEIGRGAKSSITKFASEYVSDISMLAEQIGSTTSYVRRAKRQ